jgi:hypothetical protein
MSDTLPMLGPVVAANVTPNATSGTDPSFSARGAALLETLKGPNVNPKRKVPSDADCRDGRQLKRASNKNSPGLMRKLLRVGSKIDAQFQMRTTFYPGVVETVHDDDTYDVAYDDGDKERHVAKHFIRFRGMVPIFAAFVLALCSGML